MTEIGLILLGSVAGVASGHLGIGGGTIVVPGLVYLFGMTQHKAQGTILAAFLPPVALLAVLKYANTSNIDWRAAMLIAAGIFAGSYFGAMISLSLPEVTIKRVPETIDAASFAKMGGVVDASVPVATVDELPDYDAIVFGTPTRFGNMAGQMRTFLDQTGGLWAQGKLVGKVGSVFVGTSTQHGGQETTITSFHTTLLHHGMVIAGVPYSCPGFTPGTNVCQ